MSLVCVCMGLTIDWFVTCCKGDAVTLTMCIHVLGLQSKANKLCGQLEDLKTSSSFHII